MATSPLKILKASMRSARRHLRSTEKRLSWRSLSSFSTWRRPLTSRVTRRWTLSSSFIPALSVGAFVSIAYSRCSRTMALYSGMNAVFDKCVNDWRLMKSNRLSAFGVVKVVPRGTPCLCRRWPVEFGGWHLHRRKTEKCGRGGYQQWGVDTCYGWLVVPICTPICYTRARNDGFIWRLRRGPSLLEGFSVQGEAMGVAWSTPQVAPWGFNNLQLLTGNNK